MSLGELGERIGLEHPVVQAGMGAGIAGPELAVAVSRAGGLGTVGIMGPRPFAAALREARAAVGADRPLGANLLVPFLRPAHARACVEAGVDVVTLHAGRAPQATAELRRAGIEVLQTVGTAVEARTAVADGSTALVVQGAEAGGHLVGVTGTERALAEVRAAVDVPLLAAGGVAERADVVRLLGAGAEAVVAGTCFVMTRECGVHPGYQQALAVGGETVETKLFAFGWPMRHRVLVTEVTRRHGEGPLAMNRRTGRLGGVLPLGLMALYPRIQIPGVPLYTAAPAMAGMPERAVAVSPLYAGESVARIGDVRPAAEVVAALAGT